MTLTVSLWSLAVGGAIGFLVGVIVGFRWVIWAMNQAGKNKEIEDAKAAPLTCSCGWRGTAVELNTASSIYGACPDCGNNALRWGGTRVIGVMRLVSDKEKIEAMQDDEVV